MNNTIAEKEWRRSGLLIEYHYDTDAPSPRTEYDQTGTFVMFHSRYSYGDVDGLKQYDEPFNVIEMLAGTSVDDMFDEHYQEQEKSGKNDTFDERAAREQIWKMANENAVIIGVEMLDHSGVRFRTCGVETGRTGWDSGQVGYIYTTKERAEGEGWNIDTKDGRDNVEDILIAEIGQLDEYASGGVYGYMIKDRKQKLMDSCWGFYGLDYCKQQANETAGFIETDENQTPVGFHIATRQRLSLDIQRFIGITPSEGQITAYFDGINYFQPDGSALIELGSHETLSGRPEVLNFTADDFIYAESQARRG